MKIDHIDFHALANQIETTFKMSHNEAEALAMEVLQKEQIKELKMIKKSPDWS